MPWISELAQLPTPTTAMRIFSDGGGIALFRRDPSALLTLEGLGGVVLSGGGPAPIFFGACSGLLLAVYLAGSSALRAAVALGLVGAAGVEILGNPAAAAVAPAITDSTGRPVRVAFRFPRTVWGKLLRLNETLAARRQTSAPAPGDEPQQAEYVKGACVVFRRAALEQVGLFDEQFWMFAEEIDLFQRCADRGWEVWVVPEAKIVHDGGETTRNHPDRDQSSRFRQQSYRSICRYYAKHHSLTVRLWLRFELAVRVSGRLAAEAARVALGRGDSWWVAEHLRCLRVLLRPSPSAPREGALPSSG